MESKIKLTYASCNLGTILSFIIIVPTMVATILIIKLFVDSDIFKDRHKCSPVSFFFGETSGCRRMIHKDATSVVHTEPFTSYINKEVQNGLHNSSSVVVNMNENVKLFAYKVLKIFL